MTALLSTRLTRLLGCRHPIIQTAMGWVSGPELVAATANAGGFGFLAGATIPAAEMEANIQQVMALTNGNFGVNFHMYQPNAADIVELVIKYKVKAVSYSRSPAADLIAKLKANNIICIPTVGLAKHAIKAVESGADAIVVQGGEGGGHTGAIPTTLLLPQVIDTLKATAAHIPVAAAGGFYDGKGLVAALAWGADGIAMGTRFLMTSESLPPKSTKQSYVSCKDPARVYRSTAIDGLPQRMIDNPMLSNIERSSSLKKWFIAIGSGIQYQRQTGASIVSLLKSARTMSKNGDITFTQALMSANAPMIIQTAMVHGDQNNGVLPSGQVAGVIDEIVPCQQVIESIIEQAQLCLQRLTHP